jgi:hypothetical protein
LIDLFYDSLDRWRQECFLPVRSLLGYCVNPWFNIETPNCRATRIWHNAASSLTVRARCTSCVTEPCMFAILQNYTWASLICHHHLPRKGMHSPAPCLVFFYLTCLCLVIAFCQWKLIHQMYMLSSVTAAASLRILKEL